MDQSEKSLVPSKLSIETFESRIETDSQNIKDFSSYHRESELSVNEKATQLEKTQTLIAMLIQHQENDKGLFKDLKELKLGTKKIKQTVSQINFECLLIKPFSRTMNRIQLK
jgi:hypothetical protein